MKDITISTKAIRKDLEGFLKSLKSGQTVKVLYRSKPLVTIVAKDESDSFLSSDAGSPSAAKHSVNFIRRLPKRAVVFDPDKSFKKLYDESR